MIIRNHQLDFFRGLFLVIITVDHALAYNNIIRRFTHEFVGWASAAEGFVFLSGLTTGIVYTRKAEEKGGRFLLGLAIRRARTIYRNHIYLLLFVCAALLCSPFIRAQWAEAYAPLVKHPLLAIATGSLLIYQPPFLDILPMYAIFILFTPFVIKWFRQGYAWRVLLGSFALYAAGSINGFLNLVQIPFQNNDLSPGAFNLLCWQFLFVVGILAGFIFYKGANKHWQTNNYLFLLALAGSTAFFLLKNMHVEPAWLNLDYAVSKKNLGPLRLFNFILLCYIAVFVSSKKLTWFTYRPICYLGKYSLEVFTFHIVILILLLPVKIQLNTIYSLQVTPKFYFYPLGSSFVFLCMIPLLFLAPTLLGSNKRLRLSKLYKLLMEQ